MYAFGPGNRGLLENALLKRIAISFFYMVIAIEISHSNRIVFCNNTDLATLAEVAFLYFCLSFDLLYNFFKQVNSCCYIIINLKIM